FEPLPKYKPALLPANERRRASAVVRLAFGACEDAVGERIEEASQLAGVFTASGGDYDINDQICRALLEDDKAVSPTQFHNSVHNAAAGYWSIASKSHATSVSLSSYNDSVSAGILEALTLLAIEKMSVLLVCGDHKISPPMHKHRPIDQPFAAALWLSPELSANAIAKLDISISNNDSVETQSLLPEFEAMRCDNPAAKILPLLELLARNDEGSVVFSMAGSQTLQVTLSSC
ncbi:MAG TPA: 3-oxoacyl-ACP synthase, partial [Porticoccus sp.]|nr:3-oxoacyl-ACP synthase [Porticoccus sp.]